MKKELENLAEIIRFSDPVSSAETEGIESTIIEKIDTLKLNIKADSIEETLEKVGEIKNLLSERNRICKLAK